MSEAALATVKAIASDGLMLVFDGQEDSDGKIYACNASIPFRVGDRVKCCEISGTWIAEYVVGAPNTRGGDKNYVPSGGAVAEVLAKKTAADFDLIWTAAHYVPSGGAAGTVLAKKSATDYDLEWKSTESTEPSKLTNGSYNALLTSTGDLTPKSSTYSGALGTSTNKWSGLHASGVIDLGDSSYSSTLSFFGVTAQRKITLSTTSNNQGFTSVTSANLNTTGVYVLNNIAGALKKYGLLA